MPRSGPAFWPAEFILRGRAGLPLDYYTGEVGATVSITGKTLWDEGANQYNEYIDPRIDAFLGRDVPGLGEASDS